MPAKTHGQSRTRAYGAWKQMRKRCNNPADQAYPRYGGRGIAYDSRWDCFENFVADMGERQDGMTLDRIDNDGPYCKENCRWATTQEQARNYSRNIRLTYGGVTRTLIDWAAERGLAYACLHKRIASGWSTEAALEKPSIHTDKRRRQNGKFKTER